MSQSLITWEHLSAWKMRSSIEETFCMQTFCYSGANTTFLLYGFIQSLWFQSRLNYPCNGVNILLCKISHIRDLSLKVTLSSPCLWASFHPLSPLSVVKINFTKSQYEMLQLCMKCWYSAFNAQGSWLIVVVVQLGAMKIYVAAVEVPREKERQDET
jgi:hypothetical protein